MNCRCPAGRQANHIPADKNHTNVSDSPLLHIIVVTFQTACEMRVGGRWTARIALRMMTLQAFTVFGDAHMNVRIHFYGRTVHAEVVAVGASGGKQNN